MNWLLVGKRTVTVGEVRKQTTFGAISTKSGLSEHARHPASKAHLTETLHSKQASRDRDVFTAIIGRSRSLRVPGSGVQPAVCLVSSNRRLVRQTPPEPAQMGAAHGRWSGYRRSPCVTAHGAPELADATNETNDREPPAAGHEGLALPDRYRDESLSLSLFPTHPLGRASE